MMFGGRGDPRSGDRRRWRRVRLSVPVQFGKGVEDKEEVLCPYAGETRDLGPGGAYVTLNGANSVARGDLLRVSIAIPWEVRELFPFSRIVGAGRVVRVDELPLSDQGEQTGLALEFCDNVTILGTIVTP